MIERPQFPFAAVVAMDEVKLALLIGAVEPRLGGVLLRGQKGSAKTTLARSLAALLPGSPPFVELPLSATEDRLVGTLDLSYALAAGERRFHPGLLQAVDGGVLYVDEVNLLADHLVDVLLDVAVSGVNRVEREGVSHEHGSRFFLIGSMNPEEGELRPQLLDRFGLSVEVKAPQDPDLHSEAVRRRLAFDADAEAFVGEWSSETDSMRRCLGSCKPAALPAPVVLAASRMAAALGTDGMRADLALCRAAAALAGLEGRKEAGIDDLRRVAPLALSHRRRRDLFESPGVTREQIEEALGIEGPSPPRGDKDGGGEVTVRPSGGDRRQPPEPTAREEPPLDLPVGHRPPSSSSQEPAASREGAATESASGRMITARPLRGAASSSTRVAVAATALASAERRLASGEGKAAAGAMLEETDLREVVAEQRRGRLIVLCVDVSGSMGVADRVAAARGAVLRLLTDAYQSRDRVAVVTFSGDGARVALRPTGSVEVARQRLESVPTGGRTPLAEGILTALRLCSAPSSRGLAPILVLVSDGRATSVSPSGRQDDPGAAALSAAARVRAAGVPALVVDVEAGGARLGLAAQLASAMGARHVETGGGDAERIGGAVSQLLG
jgi:magnesium chelatase subunit D